MMNKDDDDEHTPLRQIVRIRADTIRTGAVAC